MTKTKKLRHSEYYDLQDCLDELYAKSKQDDVFTNLMDNILNRSNSIFVFDEETLDFEQIKCLKDKIDILKENNIKIVIAINIGMGIYTKHFFDDYPEMANNIKIYFLSSQFTDENDNNLEIEQFNNKVSELGLVSYRYNYTILDYILKVDESSINQHRNILPEYGIISKYRGDKLLLKSLIVLSTRSAINISEAIELGTKMSRSTIRNSVKLPLCILMLIIFSELNGLRLNLRSPTALCMR